MATRVRIAVPCPYCGTWQHLDTTQEAKPGQWRSLGKLKCDACDSRFTISLKVNRSGKGKRLKEIEAKKEAERRVQIAEANDKITAELESWKALEGCECWKPWPAHAGHDSRPRCGSSTTNGIPQMPRHLDSCPFGANRRRQPTLTEREEQLADIGDQRRKHRQEEGF